MEVYLLTAKGVIEAMERNAVHAALTCTGNECQLSGKAHEYKQFLSNIIAKGHESVLEHINLTFRIEDISRALLQELARHRHISLSVQSTRHALKKIFASEVQIEHLCANLEDILVNAADALPVSVARTDGALDNMRCLEQAMSSAIDVFKHLAAMDTQFEGFVPDYIKYLIPECMPTSLLMTVNVRELRHIFKLRSGPEALLEFRRLVKSIYYTIPKDYIYLFKDVLPEAIYKAFWFHDDGVENAEACDGCEA